MTSPITRTCNRCGTTYDTTFHTCAHPMHAAIDPQCVYATPLDPPDTHMSCDICRPIRAILAE